MADDGYWFAPKRFGYGAGLPIRWQGWALLGGFLGLTAVIARATLPGHQAAFIGSALLLTIMFSVIAAPHTRGGWRWRWGSDL